MSKSARMDESVPQTLEQRMELLLEMKTEYRAERKAFKDKTKHLLDSIKSLENVITAEVLERGTTVQIEGIKAEFIPTVKIRVKRQNNEQ